MTAQDLKNSILQQAIQGKLVPRNPVDEPASERLKKISAERQKLIDEGRIPKTLKIKTHGRGQKTRRAC